MDVPDSPAGLAALYAMNALLVELKRKNLLTANEIVGVLNKHDPGIEAQDPVDHQVYQALLWLKAPHIAESVMETLTQRRSD